MKLLSALTFFLFPIIVDAQFNKDSKWVCVAEKIKNKFYTSATCNFFTLGLTPLNNSYEKKGNKGSSGTYSWTSSKKEIILTHGGVMEKYTYNVNGDLLILTSTVSVESGSRDTYYCFAAGHSDSGNN